MYGCVKWVVTMAVGSLLLAGILIGSYGIWWSWGYKAWNDEAVPIYARIEAIEIVNTTCIYKCNRYCFGTCTQCNSSCTTVFLNITYEHHHQHYRYLSNVTNYTSLVSQLSDCCTVGRHIRIYYNKNDPHDISIELHSMLIFWIVIGFTLTLTVLCITFIIIVYRRETTIFDYQSLYNAPSGEDFLDSPYVHDFPIYPDIIDALDSSNNQPTLLNY